MSLLLDEDEVSKCGRHVDVVTEAVAELTRRGFATDAAAIGEMAEEEIEEWMDRIHDPWTLREVPRFEFQRWTTDIIASRLKNSTW